MAALPCGVALAASLPSEVTMTFDLTYGGGSLRVGRAEERWRVNGDRYELRTDIIPILGPKIHYVSSGAVTRSGLVPEKFAEYRNDETTPRIHADFDWQAHEVRFGKPGENLTARLQPGAQDVNAFAFQLTWLAERAAAPMQAVTGKKSAVRHFEYGPDSTVKFRGRDIKTRSLRSGDQNQRTEVWLSPELGNLPVRIIRIDDGQELQMVMRDFQSKP